MDNMRRKILIVDDNEINRMILCDMLEDEFDLLEATNGLEAVEILKQHANEICLLLLDVVMPEMDGFAVLATMNTHHWIDDIQVIMISAETSPIFMRRAYDLGAVDFISRPFDQFIVHHRIVNTMMLYSKQQQLMEMVAEQIQSREKNSSLMVAILSHIVEFRNGESGKHVLHINVITELLLEKLFGKTDRYNAIINDIGIIRMASSLHDIGKIGIPEQILNKPGRLTSEEFETMKTHSLLGAQTMRQLSQYQDEALVRYSYQICRWHHERWDGRGYPDGLKGDDIPIAAQVVSLADVYDALTSERCYKKAFSHEKAMEMIANGECGTFNPLLIECLNDIGDILREITGLPAAVNEGRWDSSAGSISRPLVPGERVQVMPFFFRRSKEAWLFYDADSGNIHLNDAAMALLTIHTSCIDSSLVFELLAKLCTPQEAETLWNRIRGASAAQPEFVSALAVSCEGGSKHIRVEGEAVWSDEVDANRKLKTMYARLTEI